MEWEVKDIKVVDLIRRGAWPELRQTIEDWPPAAIADLLLQLEPPERLVVFRILPRLLAGEVFAYFDTDDQTAMLDSLRAEETRRLLADMAPDDRTQLFEELPGAITQQLMNMLSPSDLEETRQLLGYPEESVGRLMTPDYVAVKADWTVARALKHIRQRGKISETINRIYVVDSQWRLIDDLQIRRFILAEPEQTVEEIMDHQYVAISAFDDREQAVSMIQHYDVSALPVVDSDGVLIGIVTVDDVLDVAEEEATEDFHKGAAVAPLRTPYSEASVWQLYRSRIFWLSLLVIINLVSSGVIAAFEKTLHTVIALAFFIPLLIDSGGNTGAQSATLMVRAIATNDVDLSQWLRTFLKEIGVGVALGASMGVLSGLLGFFRGDVAIGFVVGMSMICIVIVANLVGAMLPFILTRLNIDPAVASSPLITTIADASGLLIYFTIASVVLM